jgi:hypothetical protein
MATYDPNNRQIGQIDEEAWQLMDFLGPCERWNKYNHESDVIYFFVQPNDDGLFFKSVQTETADAFWQSCCEVVSHLPADHPLNRYFQPYKPQR